MGRTGCVVQFNSVLNSVQCSIQFSSVLKIQISSVQNSIQFSCVALCRRETMNFVCHLKIPKNTIKKHTNTTCTVRVSFRFVSNEGRKEGRNRQASLLTIIIFALQLLIIGNSITLQQQRSITLTATRRLFDSFGQGFSNEDRIYVSLELRHSIP